MAAVRLAFCGGCNEGFDRAGFARRLEAEFPRHRFSAASADSGADYLIIICGCQARCAGRSGLAGKEGTLEVWREADYAAAREMLGGTPDAC